MTFSFLLIPAIAAIVAFTLKDTKRTSRVSIAFAILAAAAIFYATAEALFPNLAFGADLPTAGLWAVDSFSAINAWLVALVYVSATLVSARYILHEQHEGILTPRQVRIYYACLHAFALAMFAALFADNIGILWIALECTTLATAPLVAIYRKDASMEAAWKYLIICSIGISLGLLGFLFMAYAGVSGAGLEPAEAMSLRTLLQNAAALPVDVVKWAFVFIMIGLGTKVGFVPMHTWLPDAHGKTPSPISGMLSGVLLNVAFVSILHFRQIADATLGINQWTNMFFLVFGALSVAFAAFALLQQRNYKRMLAYSSIEHMGLAAFAAGLGPIGMVAVVVHLIGHSLIKSALFFASGEILLHFKSTKIDSVLGFVRHLPVTGSLFLIGLVGILAIPPSPLFASELLMFALGIRFMPILALLLLVCLSIVVIGMMKHAIVMLYNAPEEEHPIAHKKEAFNLTHAVIVFHLVLAGALGLWFLTNQGMDFAARLASSII